MNKKNIKELLKLAGAMTDESFFKAIEDMKKTRRSIRRKEIKFD